MPLISHFYGILIYLYKEIGGHHNEPHIHIKYNEYEMSMTLDGEIVKIKGLEWLVLRPKAIDVKPLNNYLLEITFNNGEKKIFDVKPYLEFKQFKELKDEKVFKKVKIARLSIEWENGADICPDELYNNSKK